MEAMPNPEDAGPDDATLVARSRTGDINAFAQIVARYQSLICALTFSATGRQTQSEDLAQETFIIAWKKLSDLQEPEKLRAWLGGIARNLCLNQHRDNRREPTHEAEPIESASEEAADAPDPAALAMQSDEEAMVWRALEQMPELYREPLVLYYREHQSIEHVAVELDLSEETVRQRLSRGRKLLNEQVATMVEGALARTSPGREFTMRVMSALPVASASMGKTAALAAATAAKGMMVATKATGVLGVLNILLGPLIGVLAGLLGLESGVKAVSARIADVEVPQTPEERKAAREARLARSRAFREQSRERRRANWELTKQSWRGWRVFGKPMVLSAAMTALLLIFVSALPDKKGQNPFFDTHKGLVSTVVLTLAGLALGCVGWFYQSIQAYYRSQGDAFRERKRMLMKKGFKAWVCLGVIYLAASLSAWVPVCYFRMNPALVLGAAMGLWLGAGRLLKKLLKLIKWQNPDFPHDEFDSNSGPGREYRSAWTLLGLPLLHIHTGRTADGRRAEARGWMAVGGRSVGVVAIGRTALGVVSIGPAAAGLVAIGGIAIAPLAIGCLAIGYWAAGGMALGMLATGGLALAGEAANGTYALARYAAFGDIAYAAHANDAVAQAAVSGGFFPVINWALQAGMAAGAFALLFGLAAFLMGHLSAWLATKEERKQTGRKIESKDIIHHAAGLPGILALVVAGIAMSFLFQHWSHLEMMPFWEIGAAAMAIGLYYVLVLIAGLLAVLVWNAISRPPGSWNKHPAAEAAVPMAEPVAETSAGPTASPSRLAAQSLKTKLAPRFKRRTVAFGLAGLVFFGILLIVNPQPDLAGALLIVPALICIFVFDVLAARDKATSSKGKAGWEAFAGDAASLALFSVTRYTGEHFPSSTLAVIIAMVLALRFAGEKMGVNNPNRWKFALRAANWAAYGLTCAILPSQPGRDLYLVAAVVGITVAFVVLFWDKQTENDRMKKAAGVETPPEKL